MNAIQASLNFQNVGKSLGVGFLFPGLVWEGFFWGLFVVFVGVS